MTRFSLLAAAVALLVACAGASAPPAVGVWDINMTTPLGAQDAVITINADGTGMMEGQQGNRAIDGITFDGNAVSFGVPVEAQGQSFTLNFSGEVAGSALNGEMSTPFGAFGVEGTKR